MSRSLFRNYGLTKGEPMRLRENFPMQGWKKTYLFQERAPDKIEVVSEYERFVLLRGTWVNPLHTYSYNFCVEKASIYCGEVELVRLETGERLKPKELLSDYLREQRRIC